MVLTAVIFDRVFHEPAALAWLTGLFVLIGFITHLVLDEIYAVDIEGAAIKKSFGTALKLFDYRSWLASGIMAVALIAVAFATPPARGFWDTVKPPVLFSFLKERLLPKGQWFSVQAAPTTAALETDAADGRKTR
jgi:hypothetical protein